MWSLKTFYLNGLGYLLSNEILEKYCYIFQSNSYYTHWQEMAKSLSLGPQTISQSKFSSLK